MNPLYQCCEAAADFLKRQLARILYAPAPLRCLKLPKGFWIEPFWEDKGRMGLIMRNKPDGRELEWIILYFYGEYYAQGSKDIHEAFEGAYGRPIEVRELHDTRTGMHLRVYEDAEGERRLAVVIDSDYHSLHLNAHVKTRSDIETFVALCSGL